jgi:acetyltransferase
MWETEVTPPAATPEIMQDHIPPPMRIRPLKADDGPALERLARACDPEDLRLRFFQAIGEGHRSLLAQLTRLDPGRDLAFIAFAPGDDTPLGVVRLHGDTAGAEAEFAILVRSDAHSHGIGHALMALIVDSARTRGLAAIHGQILPENARMLSLARDLGFALASTPEGVVQARLALGAGQSE